jgi:hypothetical protein
MTTTVAAVAQLPIKLSSKDRHTILENGKRVFQLSITHNSARRWSSY